MILTMSACMLAFSMGTAKFASPASRALCILAVVACMLFVVLAYLFTACRDPGIHPRLAEAPPDGWPQYAGYFAATQRARRAGAPGTEYAWSDQARSYRKPGVMFDSETRVLIENIDHFCPWTGTTIGAGNIRCFRLFLASIFILLIVTTVVVVLGPVDQLVQQTKDGGGGDGDGDGGGGGASGFPPLG